jgi:hypothetical protein
VSADRGFVGGAGLSSLGRVARRVSKLGLLGFVKTRKLVVPTRSPTRWLVGPGFANLPGMAMSPPKAFGSDT